MEYNDKKPSNIYIKHTKNTVTPTVKKWSPSLDQSCPLIFSLHLMHCVCRNVQPLPNVVFFLR